MVTRSFIDVVTLGMSAAEQAKFSAGKSEFESRLNAVRAQRFPVLTRDTLCEGLPKGRAAILMRYLQSVMASELRRVARCSTFRFATSRTATEAVKDLQEKGFPKGNFTWSYMGVFDYGSTASGRCALSGYPIRYGHVFVADENSITLVLSSNSAETLFGFVAGTLDSMLTKQDVLLEDLANMLCVVSGSMSTPYLRYCCGTVGTLLAVEGLDAGSQLMPFHVDPTLLGLDMRGSAAQDAVLSCKLCTGEEIKVTADWVLRHLYLCLNADLTDSFELTALMLPKDTSTVLNSLKVSAGWLWEFLSVGMLPPVRLCSALSNCLDVGIACHNMSALVSESDVEDAAENWQFHVDRDSGVLVLDRYIGKSNDVVFRGSYRVDGKVYTRVTFAPAKYFVTSTGCQPEGGPLLGASKTLTSVVFTEGFELPESCAFLFWGCCSLRLVDMHLVDTSRVTNMRSMFNGCETLTDLRLGDFNTSNVTDMSWMFCYCTSLCDLDVSKFDTSKVCTMASMFDSCKSMTFLDTSCFDTSNVVDFRHMFSGCLSLQSIDISRFNTSAAESMWGMFRDCASLKSLDVSRFNTSTVTDMRMMFSGCTGLEHCDVSGFNTSRVTKMYYMFEKCKSLHILDLSRFDVSKVENLEGVLGQLGSDVTLYFWGTQGAWKAVEKVMCRGSFAGTVICTDSDVTSFEVEF